MTLLSLALVALLGLQDASADAINRYIRDLGSNDTEVRETAAWELRKIGTPAMTELRKALGDGDAGRAERAARVIEEIEKGGATVAAPKQDDKDGKDATAVADVAKALRKSAQSSFSVTGEVVSSATEEPQAGADIMRLLGRSADEPVSGKLTGAVGPPFRAAAHIRTAAGGYDVFHEDGRTVERLTCPVGTIAAPLDGASQVLFVLNLEELAKSAETLATRVCGGADAKGRRFEISLPEGAIPSLEAQEDDPVTAALRQNTAPMRTVDVMVWTGHDGQVQRLHAVFHYRKRNNGRGFAGDVKYDMILENHGSAEVVIPADIKAE